MGQQNSSQMGSNSTLTLHSQFPIGKVFKQENSQSLYFLKEYSYTSEQAFQQAFIKFSKKLTQKNENILNLQKTNTKVENTFCSTFYKIVLIFEFIDHSLSDEIEMRNKENRIFQQKQIWSILFHCTLAIAHLRQTEGIQHSSIGLKDIKLSQDGIIKILPTQMIGIYQQHDQNIATTKKLATTILSCMMMKQVTNQSSQYLQALVDRKKCSKQLKKVLYLMIMEETKFIQLEEYLFTLANDENDSIKSGVSTPVVSSHTKNKTKQSLFKFNFDNQQKVAQGQNITLGKTKIFEGLSHDKQDQIQSIFILETIQNQKPDESDDIQTEQSANKQKSNFINQSVRKQQIQVYDWNLRQPDLISDFTARTNINQHNSISQQQILCKNPNRSYINYEQNINQQIRPSQPKVHNKIQSENIYTDPKLLDLIKKDLQNIQQSGRISFGIDQQYKINNQYSKINNQYPKISDQQYKISDQQYKMNNHYKMNNSVKMIDETNNDTMCNTNIMDSIKIQEDSKKNSIVNINKVDPIQISIERNQNIKVDLINKPSSLTSINDIKILQQNYPNNLILKSCENIPSKRTKQQQCFGNILDEDASFKKSKNKKLVTNLNNQQQNQVKRNLSKENYNNEKKNQHPQQTKRKEKSRHDNTKTLESQNQVLKSTQNQTLIQTRTQGFNFQLDKSIDNKNMNSQTKNKPKVQQRNNPRNFLLESQSKGPQLEYVQETYQKGQYKGQKLNNLRHGQGTFYYKEGGKYIGQWKQNKMSGKGILYYPNDQIAYEGNWKDDQLHGYGVLYNQQIQPLQEGFNYQDWENVTEFWIKYQGQFDHDNKNGKGKWYLSNGQIFQAAFNQDMVDGEGILTRSNGSRIRGIWRKNKLIRLY